MPLVAYPTELPPPSSGWSVVTRERAARSTLPGNPQARRRWRDAISDVASASWHYSADEMAIWRAWWQDTLLDGQLWFAKQAPGAGGWIDRVMRFRPASVRVQPLGNGACRVSAQLEVRGRSAAPQYRLMHQPSDTTWNPADNSGLTLSEGNLVATYPGTGSLLGVRSTAEINAGEPRKEWALEFITGGNGGACEFGIASSALSLGGLSAYSLRLLTNGGSSGEPGSITGAYFVVTNGDIVALRIDYDTGEVYVGHNAAPTALLFTFSAAADVKPYVRQLGSTAPYLSARLLVGIEYPYDPTAGYASL